MVNNDIKRLDSKLVQLTREIQRLGAAKVRDAFNCPILHVEEKTELCKGHLMPQAVGGRDWVVQRKDVDNFFGSFAEAAFVHGVNLRSKEFDDALSYVLEKGLAKQANLAVMDSRGDKLQVRPTRLKGNPLGFVVSESFADIELAGPVSFSFAMDTRYETLLACIHSLHLGLFREGGYSYVYSPSGEFNAKLLRDVYKKFSRVNSKRRSKSKTENLEQMCLAYRNLVRPIVGSTDGLEPRLFTDPFRWFLVCWDEGAREPFATIHFLKAGNEWNAVMSFARTDSCAIAIVCSAVPISFKTTLGCLANEQIDVAPLRESTPRMTWPCGDNANSQVSCPIELAAQEVRNRWAKI